MRLTNHTTHRVPRKWLQKLLDHLGVNPQIEIQYTDNPDEVKEPNCRHLVRGKVIDVDGVAGDDNRVYIYVGRWKSGKFDDFTVKYVKWTLAHELRHQYYYYHIGNTNDPWKGLREEERIRREERACNRFANLIVGVPDKHFPILRKNGKSKDQPSNKASNRRKS
jgi:hypothetical protein